MTMNTRDLLDHLLGGGSTSGDSREGGRQGVSGAELLSGVLSGRGKSALAGGALGFLLGNRKARRMGGKLAVYGGMAALGVMAYRAYGNWQQQQGTATGAEPVTVDRLSGPVVEEHGHAILRALIGAAKADGHVDDREREMIDEEVARLSSDGELQRWFDAELRKPLDPAEIASSASTPEMAAEMYLISTLVVDEQNFMEKSYLEELARQLQLDQALVAELETQASEPRGKFGREPCQVNARGDVRSV